MACWIFLFLATEESGRGGSGASSGSGSGSPEPGLSTEAIIGISVAAGVAGILLLLVVIGVVAYW